MPKNYKLNQRTMKTSIRLILPVGLLTVIFFLIITGCEKEITDIEDYGDPVISTTGEAIINRDGGTISVGDEASAIYGASIEIPRDALDENVDIKIVAGAKENIDGELVQTIEFLPKGLTFTEQVVIGIPWSSDDQNSSNSRIYYYDDENSAIEELTITNVDEGKKITYGLTSHFSRFFNKRQYYLLDYNIMKKNNQFSAYVNLYTPLLDILPRLKDSPYANAEEIIINNNGQEDCFTKLNFSLYKKDKNHEYYTEQVANQHFYIKYDETVEGWNAYVYRYDNPHLSTNQPVEIFHKSGLTFEQLEEDWLSGFAVIASFNQNCFWDANFSYDEDDQFEISASWNLVKQFRPIYSSQVWLWSYGSFSRLKTFNQLNVFTGDENNNNIDDMYEGDNNPPAIPSNPQPLNSALDVSVNTNLQWSCSDPDGDDITYKIYIGTNSTPPYVGTTENSSAYTPSGLTENTTYYWFVDATDPGGLTSTSPVWTFTTESGGGSIGCEGVTSVDYEGSTYHTVEIGEQCWFKENLNVGTMIAGSNNQSNNSVIEKYCYNDDEQSCDLDGALYQWDELMQYASNEGARGICPSGWHIPTEAEWKTLEGTVDSQYGVGDPVWDNTDWRGFDAGNNLKSTSGWFLNNNGSDSYGFTALPAGYRSTSGTFSDRSVGGKFWTSLSSMRMLAFNNDKVLKSSEDKSNGYSVRCIKD